MKPVIQEEITGCGIACTAAIAGLIYNEAKTQANNIDIYAHDQSLWSETEYIRRLLAELGVQTGIE